MIKKKSRLGFKELCRTYLGWRFAKGWMKNPRTFNHDKLKPKLFIFSAIRDRRTDESTKVGLGYLLGVNALNASRKLQRFNSDPERRGPPSLQTVRGFKTTSHNRIYGPRRSRFSSAQSMSYENLTKTETSQAVPTT